MLRKIFIKNEKLDKNDTFKGIKFVGDAITFKEWLELLIDYINEADEERNVAVKKLKEWNKDEEICQLKTQLKEEKNKNLYAFKISKEEQEAIDKWVGEYIKRHGKGKGCIGGRFVYEFVPTSIGTIGTIKAGDEKFIFRDL